LKSSSLWVIFNQQTFENTGKSVVKISSALVNKINENNASDIPAYTLDTFELKLKAIAAAPNRPDSDDIYAHLFPRLEESVVNELKSIVEILSEEIKSDILSPDKSQNRLISLRAELTRQNFDGFLIPLSDEFHGEAAPAASERLKWLTGFTGSAGFAAVLKDEAAIFIDGRYTLQVRNEVDVNLFTPRHVVDEPLIGWLAKNMPSSGRLAYDPWLHTESQVRALQSYANESGFQLIPADQNPIDTIWNTRPPEPMALIRPHVEAYTGETHTLKRATLSRRLKATNVDLIIHTLPEVVCWLLNVRGADLPSTPFALSFAILHSDRSVDWYVDPEKLSPDMAQHLGPQIRVQPRNALKSFFSDLSGKRIQIDPAGASQWFINQLEASGAEIIRDTDPCMLPKAAKNKVEIAGTRAAHIRDGAAVSKFLHWLAVTAEDGNVSELSAEDKLLGFRKEGELFKDTSFATISGAGPNGAIVHYRVTEASNRQLEPGNLYLVDSGGQYLDGTTDITRTIAIGTPTAEMKHRFTLVLKGHIALGGAIFPMGTTGSQLDTLARLPLWQQGLDYDHGTGHGVGSYLSVHEGPQRISKMPAPVPLKEGMIISNEPGYYKAGEYGIRIENLVTVVPCDAPDGAERELLTFETLTFAPIDKNLIDLEFMDKTEINWLNNYHRLVCEKTSSLLNGDALDWLTEATSPL
jgi:Xaa-Pro aminopeptidase